MRQSTVFSQWFSKYALNYSVAVSWLLLVAAASAAEAPTQAYDSTAANDATPSTSRVVQELLEIQQRLGGSIVEDSDTLTPYPSSLPIEQSEFVDSLRGAPRASWQFGDSQPSPHDGSPAGQVRSLRDAAWQLNQSAELLERCELYEKADALRELARQLRLDAREIAKRLGGTEPTQPR